MNRFVQDGQSIGISQACSFYCPLVSVPFLFLTFSLIHSRIGMVCRWRANFAEVSIHSRGDAVPTAVTPCVVHSSPGMFGPAIHNKRVTVHSLCLDWFDGWRFHHFLFCFDLAFSTVWPSRRVTWVGNRTATSSTQQPTTSTMSTCRPIRLKCTSIPEDTPRATELDLVLLITKYFSAHIFTTFHFSRVSIFIWFPFEEAVLLSKKIPAIEYVLPVVEHVRVEIFDILDIQWCICQND